MSVCSPNGVGLYDFEKNTLDGVSGCREVVLDCLDDNASRVAGVVTGFHPDTFWPSDLRELDNIKRCRQTVMAEFCVNEVLRSSGISYDKRSKHYNIGFALASSVGTIMTMEHSFFNRQVLKKNPPRHSRGCFSFYEQSKYIAKKFSLTGGTVCLPTGCAGGVDALLYALNQVRAGNIDMMVVGAVEAPITPLVMNAFGAINATSTRKCAPQEASAPFSSERDGFVLAEGGAMFLIESEQSAKERDVDVLAELKGAASINNCFHMTDLKTSGEDLVVLCNEVLKDAGLSTADISMINAHGSSTPQNDLAEASAYSQVFGSRLKNIPVLALKSQIGHALSAASVIETVSLVQSIRSGMLPVTINSHKQDRKCKLSLSKKSGDKKAIDNVLKLASGFSGIHSGVVIGRYT